MFRIALRFGRGGLIWTSAFGVLVGFSNTAAYGPVAGTTQASRAAFGRQMAAIGQQLTYLLPPPTRPDTIGGFLLWRGFGTLVIAFAFWALLSAVGATRKKEERGLIEQ